MAKELGRISLANTQIMNRWGGADERLKSELYNNLNEALKIIGASTEEIAHVQKDWHQVVEFDYAQWAIGGNSKPDDFPKNNPKFDQELSKLRDGGFAGRAMPDELENFLAEHDLLTDERKQILEDYRHYQMYREHKSLKRWAVR